MQLLSVTKFADLCNTIELISAITVYHAVNNLVLQSKIFIR